MCFSGCEHTIKSDVEWSWKTWGLNVFTLYTQLNTLFVDFSGPVVFRDFSADM